MSGHLSMLRRFTVPLLVVLWLIGSPQVSLSEQLDFILEGTGDSGVSEYSLLISVSGNLAKIAVKGSGCLGEMDASIARVDRRTWLLSSIGDGDKCEIIIKEDSDGLIETIQGPGCSYYHGAVCGFSGHFNAPTSNGLAPIFDPMG